MRSIWTGAIGFGLVNIPIKMYSAVQGSELDLDMLDKKDHSNIRFKRVNENTGKEVAWENIVKGYKRESFHDVWERNLPAAAEQNCEQCGDGGVTLECALAGRSVNLHRGCVEAWTAHNG